MPTRTAARPQCGSPWWLAVGSVLDAPAGLEALPASHGLLLDRQPAEVGPGVRDDELAERTGGPPADRTVPGPPDADRAAEAGA